MGKAPYMLDREEGQALERLRILERLQDPSTVACLEQTGVAAGWHCLEVGAGGGSIAAWLCRRVGPAGRVVATDIDTRLLEARAVPQLDVRCHDVAADPLEEAAFDLVHARNVLVHLPERENVLARLVRSVKPGGWLLVEEPDVVTEQAAPTAADAARHHFDRIIGVLHAFLEAGGLDPHFGARLPGLFTAAGLVDVRAIGHAHLFLGGAGLRSPHGMAYAQLKEAVVAAGHASEQDYEAFLALYEDPAFAWREGLTISVWGRRPA